MNYLRCKWNSCSGTKTPGWSAPLYYVAICFYLVWKYFYPFDTYPNGLHIKPALLNATALSAFSRGAINSIPEGGWSITAEILFYLSLPFFIARIGTLKKAVKVFFACWVVSFVFKLLARAYIVYLSRGGPDSLLAEEGWYFYFWFPNQLPVFVLGILAYFADKEIGPTFKKHWYLTAGLSIFFYILSYIISFYYNQRLWWPTHIIISFSFVTLVILFSSGAISWRSRFLAHIGQVSFGIYLWHFFFLEIIEYFIETLGVDSPPLWLRVILFFGTFALTYLFSWLTFEKIEQRFIEFGKEYIRLRRQNSAPKRV